MLYLWLFPHPHARRLCLLTGSVTGDQGTSSFINHVLKSSMFSLKGTCSLFDLQPAPSGITLDVELLHTSQRMWHHKTGGPETSTNNPTPKPIYSLHVSNYRQPGQIYKPCAGDRNVFNYTWSLDCQVASCSLN